MRDGGVVEDCDDADGVDLGCGGAGEAFGGFPEAGFAGGVEPVDFAEGDPFCFFGFLRDQVLLREDRGGVGKEGAGLEGTMGSLERFLAL